MDLMHLAAFAMGMTAAVLKDLLQIFLINRQMKKLGALDQESYMDEIMKASSELNRSFTPNTPMEDNSGLETNYKGYFS